MMQRNTIAINYLVTLWNMVSLYLFIPINIKVFGSEAFGVISYAATVQAILSLLDLGISTVLKREFVLETDKDIQRKLLFSIEVVYVVLLALVILLGLIVAPFAAPALIHAQSISGEVLSSSLFLIAVGAVVQVLFMIYQGALWGMGKINQSNGLQFLLSVFKNGAAIAFAWAMGASLLAFFVFQLLATVAFALLSRRLIRHGLSGGKPKWAITDFDLLKKKLSFAGGVFLIGVLAAVNAQADKIILSAKLPIADVAAYSVAFTLSQMPVVLVSPMLNIFFPQLARLTAEKDKAALHSLLKSVSLPAFFLAANVACTLFFYGKTILSGWLSEATMAESIVNLLPFLVVGGLLQSFTVLPYILSLAAKDTKTILMIQVATSALFIPVLLISIKLWGALGAAIAWCAVNCIICPVYVFAVLKKNADLHHAWYHALCFGSISVLTLAAYALLYRVLGIWGGTNLLTCSVVLFGSLALSYLCVLALVRDFSHKKIMTLFVG